MCKSFLVFISNVLLGVMCVIHCIYYCIVLYCLMGKRNINLWVDQKLTTKLKGIVYVCTLVHLVTILASGWFCWRKLISPYPKINCLRVFGAFIAWCKSFHLQPYNFQVTQISWNVWNVKCNNKTTDKCIFIRCICNAQELHR